MQAKKVFLSIILLFITSQYITTNSINSGNYQEEIYEVDSTILIPKWTSSRWSISKELFHYIRNQLPEGKVILEMGSGWASGQFSKFYTVYSIEHNKKWVKKYNTNYIYAPIVDRWYNPKIIEKKLPKEYDLILVDGPTGSIGRNGFYTYLHLFNTDVIIIFDDVNVKENYDLMFNVSKKIKRKFKIYQGSFQRKFGVIEAKKQY